MNTHRQHFTPEPAHNASTERILGIALAIFIGTGFAVALVLGFCG